MCNYSLLLYLLCCFFYCEFIIWTLAKLFTVASNGKVLSLHLSIEFILKHTKDNSHKCIFHSTIVSEIVDKLKEYSRFFSRYSVRLFSR